jgi:hypothetical protein
MRSIALAFAPACALAFGCVEEALAWGQEGHSIIAEIAQQRLSQQAAQLVQRLLTGRSLASIASWADDDRETHPATAGWHFVNIPLDVESYDAARDCKPDVEKGDCIIAALGRVQQQLRCATGDKQIEALKFAVHLVGDIHQPLHTVAERAGGNDINVDIFMRGLATCPTCAVAHMPTSFHAAWDVNLIEKTVWNWGAYVDRLENGWLKESPLAKAEAPSADHTAIDERAFIAWAEAAHKLAATVWYLRPANDVLDDRYLRDVLPIMDQQLGLAGLRLARFLNDASAGVCTAH